MKNFSYLVLLSLLLSFAASCDDDISPRPDETPLEALDRLVPVSQRGAGTFGCLVNGELWIPEVDGASDVAIDGRTAISNPFNLTIVANKEPLSDERDQILVIGSVFQVDSLSPMKTFSNVTDKNVSGDCKKVTVETESTNFIQVLFFDQETQTISGRFECTMQEPDCPDTRIEITEGRFDLVYRF